jgi:endonuclease/exonuclease/phosphatase (EEP) superfamily protein YafD
MDDQMFAAVAVVGAGALGALAGVAGASLYWRPRISDLKLTVQWQLAKLRDFGELETLYHEACRQRAEALAKLPVDTAATAAALAEALETYPAQTLSSDGQTSMGAEAMAFLQGERTTEDLAEAVNRAYPHVMKSPEELQSQADAELSPAEIAIAEGHEMARRAGAAIAESRRTGKPLSTGLPEPGVNTVAPRKRRAKKGS